MKIMYTNCQSVVNKRDELRIIGGSLKPDIILLTETWKNEGVENGFLKLEEYEMKVRKDQRDTAGGRGGGLLIYTKNSLCAWEIEMATDFNQVSELPVRRRDGGEARIYLVYRSPNSTTVNDDKLCEWMMTLSGDYVIIGDFNLPGIDWEENSTDAKGQKFLETVESKFLTQHVEEGTHESGNKLDLVLCTAQSMVRDVVKEGRIGSSDHDILMCMLDLEVKVEERKVKMRDWAKENFPGLRNDLQRNWEEDLDGKNVEETWTLIRNAIQEAMERNIPWKKRRKRFRPQWMTTTIESKIEGKKRAWARWKRTGAETDKRAYKKEVKEVKKKIKNAKRNLEKKIANGSKKKPKSFYAYLKSERGNRVKIGPLKDDNGELVMGAKEMADVGSPPQCLCIIDCFPYQLNMILGCLDF